LLKEINGCGTRAKAELLRIIPELPEVVTCQALLDDYIGKLTIKDFMEHKYRGL